MHTHTHTHTHTQYAHTQNTTHPTHTHNTPNTHTRTPNTHTYAQHTPNTPTHTPNTHTHTPTHTHTQYTPQKWAVMENCLYCYWLVAFSFCAFAREDYKMNTLHLAVYVYPYFLTEKISMIENYRCSLHQDGSQYVFHQLYYN